MRPPLRLSGRAGSVACASGVEAVSSARETVRARDRHTKERPHKISVPVRCLPVCVYSTVRKNRSVEVRGCGVEACFFHMAAALPPLLSSSLSRYSSACPCTDSHKRNKKPEAPQKVRFLTAFSGTHFFFCVCSLWANDSVGKFIE